MIHSWFKIMKAVHHCTCSYRVAIATWVMIKLGEQLWSRALKKEKPKLSSLFPQFPTLKKVFFCKFQDSCQTTWPTTAILNHSVNWNPLWSQVCIIIFVLMAVDTRPLFRMAIRGPPPSLHCLTAHELRKNLRQLHCAVPDRTPSPPPKITETQLHPTFELYGYWIRCDLELPTAVHEGNGVSSFVIPGGGRSFSNSYELEWTVGRYGEWQTRILPFHSR